MLEIVQPFVRDKVTVSTMPRSASTYSFPLLGFAVERLAEAIHPEVSQGEAPEIPRYEANRPVGSTADVDFWTTKKVREIVKSHVNYVVLDCNGRARPPTTSTASETSRRSSRTRASASPSRTYTPAATTNTSPTSLCGSKAGDARARGERRARRESRREGAGGRALGAAVTADGLYGEWRYAICRDMNMVPKVIDEAAAVRL